MGKARSGNDQDDCKGESGEKTTVDTNVRHQDISRSERLGASRVSFQLREEGPLQKRRKGDLQSASTPDSSTPGFNERNQQRTTARGIGIETDHELDHASVSTAVGIEDEHVTSGITRDSQGRMNITSVRTWHSPQTSPVRSAMLVRSSQDQEPSSINDDTTSAAWTEADEIARRRAIRAEILSKHKSKSPNLDHHRSPELQAGPFADTSLRELRAPEVAGTSLSFEENFELTKSEANAAEAVHDDGPSAADYNPDDDKIEEHDNHRDTQKTASEFHFTQNDAAAGIEDDMFADPDDMFSNPASKVNMAVQTKTMESISVARKLDETMLDSWADVEGYYRIMIGELLDERYAVQSILGKGVFSAVVKAIDQVTGGGVAIKVIRKNDLMRKAGAKEVQILETLMAADPDDRKHIVRLRGTFEHRGHLCLVFESLSLNLREVLKKFGRDIGINLKAVRAYAQQIFLALSLMRKCNIMHADIKPDNILVSESRTLLKICDLGSASDVSENALTPYLASRFYRAPEVILGLPYDAAMDVWAIGCTLYEMYTGKILFPGRSNNQMLRLFMECRGKIHQKLLRKAAFTGRHFDDELNFNSIETDKVSGEDIVKVMHISKPVKDLKARLPITGIRPEDRASLIHFIDLLERCTDLDPARRISPSDALKHPFLARPI